MRLSLIPLLLSASAMALVAAVVSAPVQAQSPPPLIRASCNTCLVGSSGTCSIDLYWDATSAPAGTQVRTIIESTGAFGNWQTPATTANPYTIPWITTSVPRRFVLQAPNGSILADSGIVQGISSSAPLAATCRGGSNFNWFNIGTTQGGQCDRSPYGVLKSFASNQTTIRNELKKMYSNGQRVLRLGLQYSRDDASSANTMLPVNSQGQISATDLQNLGSLLAMVKDEKFREVIFSFFAYGASDPQDCRVQVNCSNIQGSCQPSSCTPLTTVITQAKNLIDQVRPVLAASGLTYRIDLRNEGMPAPRQSVGDQFDRAKIYAQEIWTWYVAKYGKVDTVGFSIIGDHPTNIANRVANMGSVYGWNFPLYHQWHFYGGCAYTEVDLFQDAHQAMAQHAIPGPWIIGETYYNNADAGRDLRLGIWNSGREVLHLLQWPQLRPTLDDDDVCTFQCTSVSIAPPEFYGQYKSRGF